MARKVLTDINMTQNEVQNAALQNLASDPSNPVAGQVYFNTTTEKFRIFDGTVWQEMGTGGGTVTSVGVANATNGGLTVTGSPITTTGTIEIGHTNSITAQTTSGLYPIKVDANGHITELGTAVDMSDYAELNSPAFTGTPTAPTATAGTNTTQIATTAFVTEAVSDLESAVKYKGTVSGGNLPTTGVKNGDMYVVAEAGTYAGQAAKVGDQFIAKVTGSTTTWQYIPSGDDAGLIKVEDTITGDGSTTTFTVTHNLNTRGVTVQVYDGSTYEDVVTDIVRTTANAITVGFAQAPASGTTYEVVIVG